LYHRFRKKDRSIYGRSPLEGRRYCVAFGREASFITNAQCLQCVHSTEYSV
jgi:hypothetical protein